MGQVLPAANEVPLVYTSKGHIPAADLQYATAWKFEPGFIQFTETYTLDGEVVKQSVHVFDKTGVQGAGATANF